MGVWASGDFFCLFFFMLTEGNQCRQTQSWAASRHFAPQFLLMHIRCRTTTDALGKDCWSNFLSGSAASNLVSCFQSYCLPGYVTDRIWVMLGDSGCPIWVGNHQGHGVPSRGCHRCCDGNWWCLPVPSLKNNESST